MSFLRKRSRSQCSFTPGDDRLMIPQSQHQDLDQKSRSETFSSARSSCSEAEISDFAVQDSCVVRDFPKHKSSHLRFLSWVAYTRHFTDQITDEERKTCPLLWCRTVFQDEKLMLQHVWNCQHLSKGLYWCFHCQRPERVGKFQCRKCQGLPTKTDRVASVARKIFSKLGAKGNRHEHTGPQPEISKTATKPSKADVLPMPSVYPDEKTPFQENGPVNWIQQEPQELSNTSIILEMPSNWMAAAVELPEDSQILEMVGTEFPTHLENEAESWTENFYAENLAEWDDLPLKPSSKRRGQSPSLIIDTTVPRMITEQYEERVPTLLSKWNETHLSDTLISPLSSTGGRNDFGLTALEISPTDSQASGNSFFTDSGYSSATSLSWSFSVDGLSRNSSSKSRKGKEVQRMDEIPESWVPEPLCARPVTIPDLPTSVHALSRGPSNASCSSGRCTEPEEIAPQWNSCANLLQTFCDTLDEHITHTRTALQQMPSSSIITELLAMSRSSMVAIGLDALAGILEGRHPSAIVQVFAFTHVAYAAAISVDGDHGALLHTEAWFEDSLKWTPERQRPLYVQIAKCIWAPPSCPNLEASMVSGNLPSRSNLLLSICRSFLHIFERAHLLESQPVFTTGVMSSFQDPVFVRNAKHKVINELIKTPSIEAFIGDVIHVERVLLQGYITDVRGLELELLCAGKLASQSETAYHRFQEHITRLCSALYVAGPSRISYYIRAISIIKHVMPELRQTEATEVDNRVAEIPTLDRQEDEEEDPLEHFDFELFQKDADEALRRGGFELSPALDIPAAIQLRPPMSSDLSLGAPLQNPSQAYLSNHTEHIPSYTQASPAQLLTTSPPRQFSSGASNLIPASTLPQTTYRCHCGYVPTGEEKWKASNLRRHKRTQHPVEAKSYLCDFPGCTSHFSRSDNLRDHQRRKGHEGSSGAVSEQEGGSGNGGRSGSKRRKVGNGSKES